MLRRSTSIFLALALFACGSPEPAPEASTEALVQTFPSGSLIIPMSNRFQDAGTLRAFGLAYALLEGGVPVHWTILTGKVAGATDFTVLAPATVVDRETGASIATPTLYAGGSFVVSGADRSAALPIVTAWLASDTVTVVHDVTGTFAADVSRTLTGAPRIAVFEDGNEDIAFTDLNAAGIPDSTGALWAPGSVDLLNDMDIAGASLTDHADGALFRADGSPAYCHVTSMHWDPMVTATTREVVSEVRSWLDSSSSTHAFMECHATAAFENDASGRFLTTMGIRTDEPAVPTPLTVAFADSPFAQFDGPLRPDGGSVRSIAPIAGSTFYPYTRRLISGSGGEVLWASARLNGEASNGQITYLGGHSYSVATPISANTQTNGVRLILNSLFESDCAGPAGAPDIRIVASAPATASTSITFTLMYSNVGPGWADSAVLRDALPPGTTFVSATGGGMLVGTDVVFNLGNLAPGASGTVSFTVSVATDGTYLNSATMAFFQSLTPRTATSNTTTTVVSSGPPDTTIVTSEPNPTNDPTGDFTFAATVPGSTFECSVDGGAFAACPATFSTAALPAGMHDIAVRAVGPTGMRDPSPATYTWTVDLTPPDTMIATAEPNPTADPTGDFTFTSPEPGVTFECNVDGAGFVPCPAAFSTAPLPDGPHMIAVRAVDRAGNVDPTPATYSWTVDTRVPDTMIVTAEPSPTNDPTADFTFAATIAGSTFECSIDGGGFIPCPATFSTPPLSDGPHVLLVRAVSPAGVVDPTPAMATWTSDATAPDTFIVTAEPNPTSDPTGDFTFSSDDPAATFECSVDGAAFAACPATFSTASLADGSHTLSVRAVDALGNVDPTPAMYAWVVDSGAATFVTIDVPADGSTTSDRTPTVSGRGEPGATVTVTIDGTTIGMATVMADGTWTLTPTTPLAAGPHVATAMSRNAGGMTATDTSNFTIGAGTVVDFRQPTDGSTIGNRRPELSGTSEPGNMVEITLDGAVIGTVLTDAEGNWSIVVPADLADGRHAVSVEATSGSGDTATDAGTFDVDRTLPVVEIRNPVDQSHITSNTPTIVGTATPGLLVLVSVDGTLIGSVLADDTGAWSIPVAMALATGPHVVLAEVTSPLGDTASDRHEFVIDPSAPRVDILVPADGARIADTTPTLSGLATPGADLEIFVDGNLVGTAMAGADGSWSVTPTSPLAEGGHAVRAVARDGAGNTATDGSTFFIDTSTTVQILVPADASTVGTPRPTRAGTAEPGASVEVSLDGTVVGTVVAAGDGSWSVTLVSDVAAGVHMVLARATDEVGNTATDTSTFTYDPTDPDTDGDGLFDREECPSMPCRDSDMDGDPDFDDPDDDNDGLPTVEECTLRPCQSEDGDGSPDYLDPDDDGDGIPTRDESPGGTPRDTDLDGRPDHLDVDDDQDGLPTADEAPGGMPRDTDGDGRFDYIDPDDDNDTIPTAREVADSTGPGTDVDGDGDVNWLDTDSDGVMGGDMVEGTGDSDGDGVPDYLDPDAPIDAGMIDGGARDGGVRDGGGPDGAVIPIPGGLSGGACGCTAAGGGTDRGLGWALVLGLAVVLGVRRRR